MANAHSASNAEASNFSAIDPDYRNIVLGTRLNLRAKLLRDLVRLLLGENATVSLCQGRF